jgi:hypothetical protein
MRWRVVGRGGGCCWKRVTPNYSLIGYNLEQVLKPRASHERRCTYDLFMDAKTALQFGDLDYAEDIAQRVEHALIEQRRLVRELGVI